MHLRNILITVKDMEQSKQFYHDLFGLNVIKDFGENVILTEGLVLQERSTWEQLLQEPVVPGNASELFFEENQFDAFMEKVEKYQVEIVVRPMRNAWGKRTLLIRDRDGHLIEVAERSV